jgi:hypothetical protein
MPSFSVKSTHLPLIHLHMGPIVPDHAPGQDRKGEAGRRSGILTCGVHVGPMLTQPPRRIKRGSTPPGDLVFFKLGVALFPIFGWGTIL